MMSSAKDRLDGHKLSSTYTPDSSKSMKRRREMSCVRRWKWYSISIFWDATNRLPVTCTKPKKLTCTITVFWHVKQRSLAAYWQTLQKKLLPQLSGWTWRVKFLLKYWLIAHDRSTLYIRYVKLFKIMRWGKEQIMWQIRNNRCITCHVAFGCTVHTMYFKVNLYPELPGTFKLKK